jgi:hypothetical protein
LETDLDAFYSYKDELADTLAEKHGRTKLYI